MRLRGILAIILLSNCFCFFGHAQEHQVIGRIALETDQDYWDYLVADDASRRLYVTLGDELQAFDLDNGKRMVQVQGLKRIHGVALAPELKKAFISDGGADAILVLDLESNSIKKSIPVGKAPDAVLYEPTRKRVYAFNAHSNSTSVIDAATEKVIATVPLGGLPEFSATNGHGTIYVNLESNNSVVRLDPAGMRVSDEWPLAGCKEPSGLAIDTSGRRLFSVCANKVMIVTDADTGRQIAKIPVGNEPDAVVYDAERKLIFSSNSDGTLTIIRQENANKYTVLQNLPTEKEARTMALDRRTNKIYLPSGEITVPAPPGGLAHFKPESLHLVVVAPKM